MEGQDGASRRAGSTILNLFAGQRLDSGQMWMAEAEAITPEVVPTWWGVVFTSQMQGLWICESAMRALHRMELEDSYGGKSTGSSFVESSVGLE